MCHVDWGDYCDVWNVITPKARKEHKCYECSEQIPVGEVYVKITSLFEGYWSTHKAHKDCDDLARYIQFDICSQEVYFVGSLMDDVVEHEEEHPEVRERFDAITRKYTKEMKT